MLTATNVRSCAAARKRTAPCGVVLKVLAHLLAMLTALLKLLPMVLKVLAGLLQTLTTVFKGLPALLEMPPFLFEALAGALMARLLELLPALLQRFAAMIELLAALFDTLPVLLHALAGLLLMRAALLHAFTLPLKMLPDVFRRPRMLARKLRALLRGRLLPPLVRLAHLLAQFRMIGEKLGRIGMVVEPPCGVRVVC